MNYWMRINFACCHNNLYLLSYYVSIKRSITYLCFYNLTHFRSSGKRYHKSYNYVDALYIMYRYKCVKIFYSYE